MEGYLITQWQRTRDGNARRYSETPGDLVSFVLGGLPCILGCGFQYEMKILACQHEKGIHNGLIIMKITKLLHYENLAIWHHTVFQFGDSIKIGQF